MSYITLRALLMATLVVAAVMVGSPDRARAWTDCYGGVQDCQCYVRGVGHAYETPLVNWYDYDGLYPSPPTIAAARGNNTTYDECGGYWQWLGGAFGPHWLAASACSQYPDSDYASWMVSRYWEGNFIENDLAPPGWYHGAGGAQPYACCATLGVCN